jgi:hypothetical protein
LLETKADARLINLRRENAEQLASQAGHDAIAAYIAENKGKGSLLDLMR